MYKSNTFNISDMLFNQELSNGETLHYFEKLPSKQSEEQKAVLIFLHGNFSNFEWWLDTINHSALAEYHSISLQLRGFGKSTYVKNCEFFGDWAEDVGLFIEAKNFKRVNLIGWSFGGTISMKAAQMFPQHIQRIVLTCSVSHTGLISKDNDGKPYSTKQQLLGNPKIGYMIKLLNQNDRKSMRTVFDTILFTKTVNYPEQRKETLLNGAFQQKCYIDLIWALCRSDIQIEKIKAKTLMIHGVEDLVIPLHTVQSTGKVLGIEKWQNHAHMIPVEDIEKYATRLAKFFDQK